MKLNLSVLAADVPNARSPIIGEDVQVYFAAENCLHLGSLRATGATTGEYSPSGLTIPVGSRDVFVRVNSANCRGLSSAAMTATFDVILDDDEEDTAVATFHLPTWAPSGSKNIWGYGISADLVPTTLLNAGKKIKSIVGLVSVANMTAGNGFEIFTSPNVDQFTFIDCCRSKGGMLNLPGIIEIACGRNPAAYTKLGRGESNPLKIEFINRGALEQLAIYNGVQGTVRFDIVKDDAYLTERQLFSGFFVRANGELPDTGESMKTAEGPYTSFAIGYMRVAS